MNRPLQNGSSDTTIEILIALSVFGSSALTLFALSPRDEKKPSPASRDAEREGKPDE